MVQMVREGSGGGEPPNSSDFMAEFGVSRRTVARDLDFLRDEERAPLTYDDVRHGFRLADETYTLPPVTITRREAFSFGLARKLLAHYEGTPLHLCYCSTHFHFMSSHFNAVPPYGRLSQWLWPGK